MKQKGGATFLKDSQNYKESKVNIVLIGLSYKKFGALGKGQLFKKLVFFLFFFSSDREA